MLVNKSHLASLGIAAFMACAIPAIAQDVQNLLGAEAEPDVIPRLERSLAGLPEQAEPITNRFRIGLDCVPSSATLKSHLHLGEHTGLTVNMVLPNSPAALAGIRQHDVVVEANGHPVGEVMDLVRHVNDSQGTEMSIALIREGEEHLVKVTPEERDEDELQRLRNGFRDQLGPDLQGFPELENMFKQFPQLNQFGNGTFRQIQPGFAIPSLPNIPNAFNLRIERDNDKITVQRGDDRYEVTTDTLDQLPDDIRPLVENMLNGGSFSLHGLSTPGLGPQSLPPRVIVPPDSTNQRRLEDRFDGLELRLKELQDAIRSIEDK